jgi:hypothetical protein
MEKQIKELWNELQGLDENEQLALLEAFAELMFTEGVKAQDEDNETVWGATISSGKL